MRLQSAFIGWSPNFLGINRIYMDHAQVSWEFLAFQAEQMTDFLEFCRHSCDVAGIRLFVQNLRIELWQKKGHSPEKAREKKTHSVSPFTDKKLRRRGEGRMSCSGFLMSNTVTLCYTACHSNRVRDSSSDAGPQGPKKKKKRTKKNLGRVKDKSACEKGT